MQENLRQLVFTALEVLRASHKLSQDSLEIPVIIEHTRDYKYGEYATNIAMLIAKNARMNPRELAALIISVIPKTKYIAKVEIAGPGFINFYLTSGSLHKVVADVLEAGKNFGQVDLGKGRSVIVEYVSANPTGPLHVGHGRGASYGAAVADLLVAMGFKVHREYYVNDAGRQIHILAVSVWLRYLELAGENIHFPSNGYLGDYVVDIARLLHVEYREKFRRTLDMLEKDLPLDADKSGDGDFYVDALIARAKDLLGSDYEIIFHRAVTNILADIREDLEEFGVTFQEWFYESGLVKSGDVARSISRLNSLGCIYEKDGATWFRATLYGDEKDRVVIRENGQYTYFASDMAYHFNKYERGFDLMIDVLGADHHGYAPRIRAFLQAADFDIRKLVIEIVQFANLYRGKTKIAMSTRGGNFVTLRKLREEVGNDAARFFYIMRKNDQHLDFDLELAKSQSKDNPVYYIQYAHARVCSVMRQLEEKSLSFDMSIGLKSLHLLGTTHEIELLRSLTRYADILQQAALKYEPHLLAHYLLELANDYHAYYNAEQFLVSHDELRNARLCLNAAVRQILFNGLFLLGVSAPEMM